MDSGKQDSAVTGMFLQCKPPLVTDLTVLILLLESFPQMCFEGKWLQNRDHFWRSISRDTNMEASALSPTVLMRPCNKLALEIICKSNELSLESRNKLRRRNEVLVSLFFAFCNRLAYIKHIAIKQIFLHSVHNLSKFCI